MLHWLQCSRYFVLAYLGFKFLKFPAQRKGGVSACVEGLVLRLINPSSEAMWLNTCDLIAVAVVTIFT